MSNRLFQGVIHQMKDAIDRVIGVIDENGVIISCSELVKIGEIKQGIRDEIAYANSFIKETKLWVWGACTWNISFSLGNVCLRKIGFTFIFRQYG